MKSANRLLQIILAGVFIVFASGCRAGEANKHFLYDRLINDWRWLRTVYLPREKAAEIIEFTNILRERGIEHWVDDLGDFRMLMIRPTDIPVVGRLWYDHDPES